MYLCQNTQKKKEEKDVAGKKQSKLQANPVFKKMCMIIKDD